MDEDVITAAKGIARLIQKKEKKKQMVNQKGVKDRICGKRGRKD